MKMILGSRLIPTLIVGNIVAGLSLALPYALPLPSEDRANALSGGGEDLFQGLRALNTDTQVVLAKPIFHKNRRPPVEEVQVAAPVVPERRPEAPFRLVGIMGASEDNRTAYLESLQDQATIVAKNGDTLEGWEVVTIGANFITLTFGGERKVLELNGGS